MAGAAVGTVYRGWQLANERLVSAIRPLTAEQLALPIGAPPWPLWSSVAHLAGARVYWLCVVFAQPGQETTPFCGLDLARSGWEDDLAHPRRADELVEALESSWRIVQHALDTWTLDSLGETARRPRPDGTWQHHTRQSVLYRMLTHDTFHLSEVALTLGANGLHGDLPNGPIDIWTGLARVGP